MFSLTIAAASTMLALQAAPVERPTAVWLATATSIVAPTDRTDPARDHLDSARKALAAGAFDVARREFVIAAALERDAGRMPVEASFGLAHALFSQGYNREAAIVMGQLAQEAAKKGDVETEARALADAVWLNVDCGERNQARSDAVRLRALQSERGVSAETRKLIKSRIG